MSRRNFLELLRARWTQDRFVCVGLDTNHASIPATVRDSASSPAEAILRFNRQIVDATADLVCAYKPNSAYHEAQGAAGIQALIDTIAHIREKAPHVPVILDAKRGDIGNTNQAYARFVFDTCQADAITVHPYLGREALQPFLERTDRGILVLARTSNPGGGEFQDLILEGGGRLYERVAENVARSWNHNRNCGLVAGATYPEELRRIRQIAGDMPLLIPGIGAQGGDLESAVAAGVDGQGQGIIINSSRAIIFASSGSDYAEAARRETERLHQQINQCRQPSPWSP